MPVNVLLQSHVTLAALQHIYTHCCYAQEYLAAEGKQLEDGSREDPTLDRFEAEIAKYRGTQEEIQALPTSATIGYIKIDAKPIKQALSTWVTKWIYLFTHYLQIKV